MGEDAGHVAEDAFEEVDDLVLADIEHVVGDAARQAHAVLLRWVATEFGIGGDGSHHVAGEVDFGKDFDVALGSVGHDFAELVLRIVHAAAVLRIVIESGGGAGIGERTAAHGSYLRQTGIFGDFDAPALVVGEVPVEAIHLVEGHDVEHALNLLHTEEVARHVHHETAMTEEGAVLNADIGQGPFYGIAARELGIEEGAGEQLTQGLEGVEEACGGGGLDGDALGRHVKVVGFLSESIVLNEANIVVGLCALGRAQGERNAAGSLELGCEGFDIGLHLIVGIGDGGQVAEGIVALLRLHGQGLRNDSNTAGLLECGGFYELDGVVDVALGP